MARGDRAKGEERRPSAVSVGGLDPSSGAGLAADLRAFSAAEVWGAAVCASLTVQSTRGVVSVRAVPAKLVAAQLDELATDLDVRALKTGALGSASNTAVVRQFATGLPDVPLVVDPVMLPTQSRSGARLDGGSGKALLALARVATLVTPNWAEAAALLGARAITSDAAARDAAVALVDLGCNAALVKGGHGKGRTSIDWLATQTGEIAIAGPRRATGEVHGTGCHLASLIAGRLAALSRKQPTDTELEAAVRWARQGLDAALRHPLVVGRGLRVLDTNRAIAR